jgi:hypothetical protein
LVVTTSRGRTQELFRVRPEPFQAARGAEVVGFAFVFVFAGSGFRQDFHFADGIGLEGRGAEGAKLD